MDDLLVVSACEIKGILKTVAVYLEDQECNSGWGLVAVLRGWGTQRRREGNSVQEVLDELHIADSCVEEGETLMIQAKPRSLVVL